MCCRRDGRRGFGAVVSPSIAWQRPVVVGASRGAAGVQRHRGVHRLVAGLNRQVAVKRAVLILWARAAAMGPVADRRGRKRRHGDYSRRRTLRSSGVARVRVSGRAWGCGSASWVTPRAHAVGHFKCRVDAAVRVMTSVLHKIRYLEREYKETRAPSRCSAVAGCGLNPPVRHRNRFAGLENGNTRFDRISLLFMRTPARLCVSWIVCGPVWDGCWLGHQRCEGLNLLLCRPVDPAVCHAVTLPRCIDHVWILSHMAPAAATQLVLRASIHRHRTTLLPACLPQALPYPLIRAGLPPAMASGRLMVTRRWAPQLPQLPPYGTEGGLSRWHTPAG